MKAILIVLFFFVCVSLGIGVFFFQRGSSVSTQTKAAFTTQTLPVIITDCQFINLTNCPQSPAGIGRDVYIKSQVEQSLQKNAPTALYQASHPSDPSMYLAIGQTRPAPTDAQLSSSGVISQLSLLTGIQYKLLIALLATDQKSVWYGQSPLTNPLHRSEMGFVSQLVGVSTELSALYTDEVNAASTGVSVGKRNYAYATPMNAASRALYSYFAKTSTSPEEFEQTIGLLNTTSPKSFRMIWQKLFKEFPTS